MSTYEDLRRWSDPTQTAPAGAGELKRLAQRAEPVWRVEVIVTPGPVGTRDGGALVGAKARYGDGTMTADEAEAEAAKIHSSDRCVKARRALANHW